MRNMITVEQLRKYLEKFMPDGYYVKGCGNLKFYNHPDSNEYIIFGSNHNLSVIHGKSEEDKENE